MVGRNKKLRCIGYGYLDFQYIYKVCENISLNGIVRIEFILGLVGGSNQILDVCISKGGRKFLLVVIVYGDNEEEFKFLIDFFGICLQDFQMLYML